MIQFYIRNVGIKKKTIGSKQATLALKLNQTLTQQQQQLCIYIKLASIQMPNDSQAVSSPQLLLALGAGAFDPATKVDWTDTMSRAWPIVSGPVPKGIGFGFLSPRHTPNYPNCPGQNMPVHLLLGHVSPASG